MSGSNRLERLVVCCFGVMWQTLFVFLSLRHFVKRVIGACAVSDVSCPYCHVWGQVLGDLEVAEVRYPWCLDSRADLAELRRGWGWGRG